MKIALEDKDIDAIAKAVAKAIGGKAKASAAAEDDAGGDAGGDDDAGGDAGGDDFEGAGEGGGDEGDAKTRDDVKEALTAVSKKFDQDTAMAILKKSGGASALSKLKEDKFEAVIKACNAKVKAK